VRDEGEAAALARTRNVPGAVGGGIEVARQIARRAKESLARGAVMVEIGLPVMLVQTERVLEELAACNAVVVVLLIMIFELFRVIEVLVAALAIVVHGALHEMLL
jgi:hypothetical protein